MGEKNNNEKNTTPRCKENRPGKNNPHKKKGAHEETIQTFTSFHLVN